MVAFLIIGIIIIATVLAVVFTAPNNNDTFYFGD